MQNQKEKFSLKDHLFNKEKVEMIANAIFETSKSKKINFDKSSFIKDILNEFPKLELKDRIICIAENFKKYFSLAKLNYRESVELLLKSLPAELDPTKTDDDFGDFIYAPFSEFVVRNGLDEKDLDFSLSALYEITKRFSAEDAIRYFINKYPKQTLKTLLVWSKDKNYHVRRLCSEGTRPRLPWSQKIILNYKEPISILSNLYTDKTRYVVRSVANHLNDISKLDPEFVLNILKNWKEQNQKNKKQSEEELNFLIKHSLRNLVKDGHKPSLKFLGIDFNTKVEIEKFIYTKKVKLNQSLEFSFEITNLKNSDLVIDYIIYFQNKSGKLNSKKVFKLKSLKLEKNKKVKLEKKHLMKAEMTTRTLYKGEHKLLIQINGEIKKEISFDLI